MACCFTKFLYEIFRKKKGEHARKKACIYRMTTSRDVISTINGLKIKGQINLGKCCKKTMHNWLRDINAYLTQRKDDWRVIGHMEDGNGIISAITMERYNLVKQQQ